MEIESFPLDRVELVDAPFVYENNGSWGWESTHRDHYNLWICLEGNAELICDGITYDVVPWSAFILPPDMEVVGHLDEGSLRNFSAHWMPADGVSGVTGFDILGVKIREVEVVMPLIQYLLRLPVYPDTFATKQSEQLLISILGIVWRERHSLKVGSSDALIYRQIERLRSGGDLFISVDALAAEAKLSRMHYTRVFTQLTTLPPNRYLIQLRIERASVLLMDTNWTIDRIASEVGYADAYFFGRQFRRIQGQSPGRYRKRMLAVRS